MTPFYKVSGAGNDFIALVEPPARPGAEEIRAWCRRGLSHGADGLFVLEGAGPGAARMTYWNADGGEAALCLNGTRCAARLAFDLGWAAADGLLTVETGAGPFAARRLGPAEIAVEVPPLAAAPEAREVEVDGRRHRGWAVTVGVPHFVLERPGGLADAPVASLGPGLRRHPAFGAGGTNVDFVRFADARPGPRPDRARLEVRSFERGVEAETLACGTGVLAAVAAGLAAGRLALPAEAATRGGFALTVDGESDGGLPRRWSLAGDARIVARGELSPDAASLPAPPPWA
ncbi:MAG TPA: diaminopimelate epimerase [Thermoanaerobaculia bacterium]|nr:diaminopimelate epimerase [Thermoanaerobaculia bacterium]